MRRPGLRTRVTATFALGALAVSTVVAIASYDLTRNTLFSGRERSAVRSAYTDASIVQAGLAGDNPDVISVLRSLDTGASRHALVYRGGRWYARNADAGITAAVPAPLQAMVVDHRAGVQRVIAQGAPALAIGIPLDDGAQFYIIDSLSELRQTLRTMALVLAGVAAGTTAAGALMGAYAARRVIRPLSRVTAAAREISNGDLTARLDPAAEPDLERLATSFNDMVEQLSSRMERDRRFAADVSHELRSPLQTLAAAASTLDRRRERLDPSSATAVALVCDEVDRFQDLVTDLLELARSDQPCQLAPTDVAAVVHKACRSREVPDSAIVIASGTHSIWWVDRRRVEQILVNLLENAQRHGGGVAGVQIWSVGGSGIIDVDDDGPGVAPAHRQTIFHRFTRGAGAPARGDSRGAGLGLAIVAEHVAAHGGNVRVMERPGGGARFRVELPVQAR